MNKYLKSGIILLLASTFLISFSSCKKNCSCSVVTDGSYTDYEQNQLLDELLNKCEEYALKDGYEEVGTGGRTAHGSCFYE